MAVWRLLLLVLLAPVAAFRPPASALRPRPAVLAPPARAAAAADAAAAPPPAKIRYSTEDWWPNLLTLPRSQIVWRISAHLAADRRVRQLPAEVPLVEERAVLGLVQELPHSPALLVLAPLDHLQPRKARRARRTLCSIIYV